MMVESCTDIKQTGEKLSRSETVRNLKPLASFSIWLYRVIITVRRFFFIFCFTDFFRNKLAAEDEIKIKIKFIRTIFQLN